MTFAEQIEGADLDVFLESDEFGSAAIYTPYGGSASTITVILNPELLGIDPYSGEREMTMPNALAKTSDIPSAHHKDVFIIKSVTYEITKAIPIGSGITELTLNKIA